MLVDHEVRLGYQDVYQSALSVGKHLSSIGVNKGDRVGVLMNKDYRQVIAQLGVMSAKAVMVPISELLKSDQVHHIISDCHTRVLIVENSRIDDLNLSGLDLQIIPVSGQDINSLDKLIERRVGSDQNSIRTELVGSDNAAIIYSSGSTGLPKGIVLSHRNLWDGARIVSDYLGLSDRDKLAQVLSLNFDYGMNQVFSTIHVGAELHITKLHFPKDLFSFIERSRITNLALMPIFINRLFDPRFFKPSFTKNIDTLKRLTTTGGRLSIDMVTTIRKVLPNTDLYLMYGLTEAFRSTYLPPEEVVNRPDSIGRAIPDVEIMILDDKGNKCQPGELGELVHRGGVMSKGYWNAPEKTAERFRTWTDQSGTSEVVVYSGDVVRCDEDGYIYFVGRRDNMIKTAGHRVSPEEVEKVTEEIEGISYAIAFGREHPILGEEIVLVCICDKGLGAVDASNIKKLLQKRLPSFMVPNEILFQDSVKLTAANQGKVDRTLIRESVLTETLNQ